MNELSETRLRLSHSSIGGSARLHVNEEHSEGVREKQGRANNAAVPSPRSPAGGGILLSVMGTKGQKGPRTPAPGPQRCNWLLSSPGHIIQNCNLFHHLNLLISTFNWSPSLWSKNAHQS